MEHSASRCTQETLSVLLKNTQKRFSATDYKHFFVSYVLY